jgi:hypothetical protein
MLQKILPAQQSFECCRQHDMHVVVGIFIPKSDGRSFFFIYGTFMLQVVTSNVATITFECCNGASNEKILIEHPSASSSAS